MANKVQAAYLAGGCFWGMEDLIRRQTGVLDTRVGYTGGEVPNATYRNHGTHAEAIEIVARGAGVHHLHRAAREPEGHRPERAGACPVEEVVDLCGEKAALGEAFGAFRI